MAVLPVWHPDIYDFIKAKSDEGVITNFNISVGVTDAFMEAVANNDEFALRHPEHGDLWRMVSARELFREIVSYAHRNGEPGVLFLDAAQRENPVPHLYPLEATNPCGEQFLGPYENCCLGSINLRTHVKKLPMHSGSPRSARNDRDDKADLRSVSALSKAHYAVDWEALANTVRLATRFLDDVVDVNKYVPSVPELEEAAHKVRRIGLSLMGLSDMMYLVGVRYGSKEGQDFASQVMEFIRYHTMQASVELARYRGSFPAFPGSVYDPDDFQWHQPKPLVRSTGRWGRPNLDWQRLVKDIKEHGIRNGAQNTIAPTGSIATVSGLEGYGCEPVFALSYTRHTREGAEKNGDEWREMYYESGLFADALEKAGLSKKERDVIFALVRENEGSCQGVSGVPKAIQDVFVVASDLSVEEHVRMQAALQRFVDNSISKTINFPKDATPEDVARAYQLGWELGLKGMTVYVEGSREQVVLEKKGPFEPNGSTGSPQGGNGGAREGVPMQSGSPRPARNDRDDRPDLASLPDLLCPECGSRMRKEEGCSTCSSCGYSHCDV